MRQIISVILLLLFVLLPLGGCGKIGSPALPPGEKTTYPRTYPSGNTE